MSAWEWLTNLDNIGRIGSVIGGVGQAYGAVQQSKMANKMYDLQKSSLDREIGKENQAQANMDLAISDVYGDDKKKKKQASFDLGGTSVA